jgi:hypothetical protein
MYCVFLINNSWVYALRCEVKVSYVQSMFDVIEDGQYLVVRI